MTKREKVQRWVLRLLIGDDGLEKLEDAEVLQAMREAHSAYRNFKATEAQKGAAEDEIRAAGSELARALKGYGELRGLPWPAPDYDPGFRNE